jgi:hypothetical protein
VVLDGKNKGRMMAKGIVSVYDKISKTRRQGSDLSNFLGQLTESKLEVKIEVGIEILVLICGLKMG